MTDHTENNLEMVKLPMTVDEALAWADANSAPEVRERLKSRAVAYALAQEVRRLREKQ